MHDVAQTLVENELVERFQTPYIVKQVHQQAQFVINQIADNPKQSHKVLGSNDVDEPVSKRFNHYCLLGLKFGKFDQYNLFIDSFDSFS